MYLFKNCQFVAIITDMKNAKKIIKLVLKILIKVQFIIFNRK